MMKLECVHALTERTSAFDVKSIALLEQLCQRRQLFGCVVDGLVNVAHEGFQSQQTEEIEHER